MINIGMCDRRLSQKLAFFVFFTFLYIGLLHDKITNKFPFWQREKTIKKVISLNRSRARLCFRTITTPDPVLPDPVPALNLNAMSDSAKFRNRLLELQDNLLNFAFQLTTNREAAEDLVQETALKVLDNEEKYADNTNFKGWVFTIMRNIFINNYRHRVRSNTIIDTSEDLYQLNVSTDTGLSTPDGSYAEKEISKAINSFTDDYRVPFTMYLSGYHYSEIADHMKLPIGTVKSRIFFARKRLQVLLKDYR